MKPDKDKTLWGLMRGQRLRYGGAIGAMALGYVFLMAVPVLCKHAIDGALDLWLAAGVVVGATAVGGAFVYLRGRWAAMASEAIARRLRDRLYGHLEHLPCAYHDRAETGDLVQRCTSDVETVRVFLSGQIIEIGRAVLLLLTVVPVLLWLDVRMTLVSLALFPIILAFAVVFFRRVKALFLQVDEAEGKMTAVLQENLTGIRVVRAFARQEFECDKFASANGRHRDLHHRLFGLLANYWGASDLLCIGQIGVVLVCGAYWLQQGTLTVGTLFACMSYVAQVIWPVRHLGRVLTDTGKAIVALRRLQEVLSQPRESEGGLAPAEPLTGRIEVEGLRFAFGAGEPALRDLSFEIAPGESVALLGPPGSGKSTFVQLLLRLYDYDQGSVRLDGRELKELDRKHIRAQVGVVMQEPFLYSKSIEANLRVGRSEASEEDLVKCSAAACVHDAIQEFDQGYRTLVGERGVTLSGGQRQRVALARALLKDPPILILDDALSAVDTATETQILGALERRRGRKTTILIAHRLSSVAHSDRILVLDRGAIVQAGTHGELAARDGPYRRLWRIQGAVEDEVARAEGAQP